MEIDELDLSKLSISAKTSEPEDEVVNCFASLYKPKSEAEETFLEKLKTLNCHFTWDLTIPEDVPNMQIPVRKLVSDLERRIKEEKYENEFSFTSFLCFVQLGFYQSLCEPEKAKANLDKAQTIAETNIPEKYSIGLKYVVCANKTFLAFIAGEYAASEAMLAEINEKYTEEVLQNAFVLKGVYGVTLVEKSSAGTAKALPLLEELSGLDPTCADWRFHYGVALMILRRKNNGTVTEGDTESQILESAHTLSKGKNSLVKICLAQNRTERQTAPILREHIIDTARILYTEALTLKPESPLVNLRCAEAFAGAFTFKRHTKKAEACFRKAVHLTGGENTEVIEKAVAFYESMRQNYNEALELIEKLKRKDSKLQIFSLDAMHIRLKLRFPCKKFDILKELGKLENNYKEDPSHIMYIKCFKGFHWYLHDGNLFLAMDEWKKGSKLDRETFLQDIENITSFFVDLDDKYSMKVLKLQEVLQNLHECENDETEKQLLKDMITAITKFTNTKKMKKLQASDAQPNRQNQIVTNNPFNIQPNNDGSKKKSKKAGNNNIIQPAQGLFKLGGKNNGNFQFQTPVQNKPHPMNNNNQFGMCNNRNNMPTFGSAPSFNSNACWSNNGFGGPNQFNQCPPNGNNGQFYNPNFNGPNGGMCNPNFSFNPGNNNGCFGNFEPGGNNGFNNQNGQWQNMQQQCQQQPYYNPNNNHGNQCSCCNHNVH